MLTLQREAARTIPSAHAPAHAFALRIFYPRSEFDCYRSARVVSERDPRWTVIDLFSGAGGMSYGFHAHPDFRIAGAVDAQKSKPSRGSLSCNETYLKNIAVIPLDIDLQEAQPAELAKILRHAGMLRTPTVLTACPPCTGFSRTLAKNHKEDDPRNSLVAKVADFAAELKPKIVIVENARELLRGKFKVHSERLIEQLTELGYTVHSEIYRLDRFGLPQRRERSIITATLGRIKIKTLGDLWAGLRVNPKALTVRRAIWDLPEMPAGAAHSTDPDHGSSMVTPEVLERIKAIPKDGGSWKSLFDSPETTKLATPAMCRSVADGRTNHFSDVYGRMAWDAPAPVIKRECSHVGNGRYTHPEQDRLCTVRELALLQGFPLDYRFEGGRQNAYRHVGDAVPPIISHQLAWLCSWMLGGKRPDPADFVLPGTTLSPADAVKLINSNSDL